MIVYSGYGDFGFDLQTIVDWGRQQITNFVNPPRTNLVNPPPPPQMQLPPRPAPLTTIAGVDITPARLLIGAAAIGGVIYFARRKRR